nr:MAG TPA: hypothetical protein [Caudoviricetes sp.]
MPNTNNFQTFTIKLISSFCCSLFVSKGVPAIQMILSDLNSSRYITINVSNVCRISHIHVKCTDSYSHTISGITVRNTSNTSHL